MDISTRIRNITDAEAIVESYIRQDVHGPQFVEALRLLIVALIEADPTDASITVKGRKALDLAETWARRRMDQHHGKA